MSLPPVQPGSDGETCEKVSLRGLALHRPRDAHRVQIERMMARADKPIELPVSRRTDARNGLAGPKDFVRNVQGSSAGAGSGDFHVYRAHRRREYARQKEMDEQAKKDLLQSVYEAKITANKTEDEQKTDKNRAKRQRRKLNQKEQSKKPKITDSKDEKDTEESEVNDVTELTLTIPTK